ncbi:Cu(I)-responsive transcriptional regulator [Comamonas serinivorans]|uniref:Cu(I)-responsive transcriptional regulator n=1 Tax=Comamonas serinivorans TaxID=1082851 RepID=A0A1Y0EKW4_9BURK|nr:Cu(I)-responsive transcriptional regulator [Comamonas serinivorans]ARU03952.1 Cu(I)-responsive transcriptional regulator [Comamonas serinivorans]
MNIGEASKASKISAKMIRYYEQIGLTPPADRTDSGYRTYSQHDVHRLHFIRRARDLGFSVAKITDLLQLWDDKSRQSADVKSLTQQHLAELGQHIANMLKTAEVLKALIHCCAGDEQSDCPILYTLQQPDTSAKEPEARTGAVSRRTHANGAAQSHVPRRPSEPS